MEPASIAAYLISVARNAEKRAMEAEHAQSLEQIRQLHIVQERHMASVCGMLSVWIMRHDPEWIPPESDNHVYRRTFMRRLKDAWNVFFR